MQRIIVVMITIFLAGCETYGGGDPWKRNSCDDLVVENERIRCVDEAIQKESDAIRAREAEAMSGK